MVISLFEEVRFMSFFVDDKLFTVAPEDLSDGEKGVYEKLSELGIPFEGVKHQEAWTIEDCLNIEKVLNVSICKNLFLHNSNKSRLYLLILPGSKKFFTKDLSKQINSTRMSFAGEDLMQKYLRVSPGYVSALGLIYDTDAEITFLVDRDLLSEEYLGFHPCMNTSTIKIKTDDLLNNFIPATKHTITYVEL